jgi:fructoselysine-6-P-deglycase FrlB-like protein
VSLARSGNSPESCGVLDSLRDSDIRHLVITCNRAGRLATNYADDPRVTTVVLNDKTCDRSLVMTSSFTNMVLAGQVLGMTRDPDGYRARGATLARLGGELLLRYAMRSRGWRARSIVPPSTWAADAATVPRARARSRCWR